MEASHNSSEYLEAEVDLVERGGRSWTRPSVSRISAGSAEDAPNGNPDAGVVPS